MAVTGLKRSKTQHTRAALAHRGAVTNTCSRAPRRFHASRCCEENASGTVVLKIELASDSLGGLIKIDCWAPPQDFLTQ